MSWETMNKAKKESEAGSMFVKLADGQEIKGIFRGDPYCYYSVFKDKAEYQTWSEGRSFRFKINFLAIENGILVPKIYQGGATVRDALLDAKQEYGLDCIYKIKRTGSGKEDTRYSILFQSKLTPDQIAKANAIPLKQLTGKVSVDQEDMGQVDVPEGFDDIPPPTDSEIPF